MDQCTNNEWMYKQIGKYIKVKLNVVPGAKPSLRVQAIQEHWSPAMSIKTKKHQLHLPKFHPSYLTKSLKYF